MKREHLCMLWILGMLWILAAILFLVCCDQWPTEEERFKPEIVVYGFLVAGQPVDSLIVQQTVDITRYYSDETASLTKAAVVLHCSVWTDSLEAYPTKPGFYYGDPALRIAHGETYHLEVATPGFPQVFVSTTVPGTVAILSKPAVVDTILYDHDNDRDAVYSVQWTEVPDAKGYYCVIKPHTSLWIRNSIDKAFNNEDNPPDRDEATTLSDSTWYDIPHLFFSFAGLNTLKVYAVTEAFYDYVRTVGDETPLSNIEGGHGYFASGSVDSMHVYVKATQDTVDTTTLEDNSNGRSR